LIYISPRVRVKIIIDMKRSRDIQSFFQKKRKESEPATATSSSEKVQSGQQLRYSSSEEQSAPSAQDGK